MGILNIKVGAIAFDGVALKTLSNRIVNVGIIEVKEQSLKAGKDFRDNLVVGTKSAKQVLAKDMKEMDEINKPKRTIDEMENDSII